MDCADLHLHYKTPFIHYHLHLITTSLIQLLSPLTSITLRELRARYSKKYTMSGNSAVNTAVVIPCEITSYRLVYIF